MKSCYLLILGLIYQNMGLSIGDPFYAHRLSHEIDFDGNVNDNEWGAVPLIPFQMQIPVLNGKMTELTEAKLAYDDDYIYLAGKLYDSEPHKILANTKKRDALTAATQFFGMVIDSYNDDENALSFFTTPTGIRWDAAVFNDALGELPINISWNAFWDVKVERNDSGWSAEIRVPFSSLAFEEKNGEVIMGITIWRYIARKNEAHMFPLIPQEFGDWSAFRPSMAQDMIFKGIKSKKPFYVTPYILTGHSNIYKESDDEKSYIQTKDFLRNIGGDIKYGISKNVTIDLTVNTDFAQVEADDQQVNLTRFNLFFPEKRLFFQERSGIFSFNFGRSEELFYSRRIGIDEDGNLQKIYGGARVVARSGDWDFGLINMQTGESDEVNGENFTVIRAKRRIINRRSDAGVIVTNRMDLEGNYNMTYGLDATIEVMKESFMSLRWAQTISSEHDNDVFSLDPSIFWLSLSNMSQRGFAYGTSFSRAGEQFDPGLGFLLRENYTRMGNRTQYGWIKEPDSPIYRHGFDSGGIIYWDNETGFIQSANWRIGWEWAFKNSAKFNISFNPNYENLNEEFELADDIIVSAGTYDFYAVEGSYTSPQTQSLWTSLNMDYGSFYDGNKLSFTLSPTLNLSSSLELSGSYEFNRARFDLRNEILDIHLFRLKSLVMLNTQLSLSAFLQYNSLSKRISSNLRFRYNPAEGNDLYIVLNDDSNRDRFRESPYLPNFNQRSIQLKYSYTFRL